MLIVTGGVFKKQGSERLLYSTEVIAPFVLLFFAPKYSLQILSGSREGFSQRGGGAWRPSKRVVSLPPSYRGYSVVANTDIVLVLMTLKLAMAIFFGISVRGATLDNTFYLIGG